PLLDPALDRRLVAFDGSPRWPLPRPAQLIAHDVPHVSRVVGHPSLPLDHLGHTRQRPQVSVVAVGFGTVGQRRFYLGELLAAQFRSPSGSARRAQRRSTRLPPGRAPVGHDLMGYPDLAGNLRGDDTLLEQIHGTHPPLLHGGEVTLWPHASSSANRPYRELLAGHL